MQKAALVIAAVTLALTALMAGIAIAQWAGVEFGDAMAAIADSTGFFLPFTSFIAGVSVGIAVRSWQLQKILDEKDEEIANLSQRPTKGQIDAAVAEKQAIIDRLMNRREYARMTFRGLSYAELEKVREIAKAKRAPFMSMSDAAVVGLVKSGVLEIADDSTYVPPDSFQVRLKESFRALAVEFSDVLDEVIGEIEAMDK